MKIGEKFNYSGIEWICLDVIDGNYLAITAQVWQELPFDNDNKNNWKESSLRKVLNNEFLDKLDKKYLIKQTSDLIADNGDKAYGTCKDYVTILSCDQYRKYRTLVLCYPEWMWTLTPCDCSRPGIPGITVRYVRRTGDINQDGSASFDCGVAPVVLFSKEFIRDIDKDVEDCVNVVRCKNCKYYKRISDLAINCIYEIEDALYRGSKNDWATEAINEFTEKLKTFESEKDRCQK